MSATYIVLIVVAVILLWVISVYNSLIKVRNQVDESWSDMDVQLKRRYDLIPNLVETVKGYATHEQGTLTKVIEARNSAMQAHNSNASLKDQLAQENALSATLKSIFALSEAYPDLKANQNFLDLQAQLKETEEKIQDSRRFYNGMVRDFNTKIQVFPTNILAGMLNFTKREFFEVADAAQRENVAVKF